MVGGIGRAPLYEADLSLFRVSASIAMRMELTKATGTWGHWIWSRIYEVTRAFPKLLHDGTAAPR